MGGGIRSDEERPAKAVSENGLGLSERLSHWLVVVAVALAAFGYGLVFHDQGIVMGEEGLILAEAEAILSGKVLYRDIDGFVAPGIWYLTALVFGVAGADLNATRLVMVLLFSATAVLVFSLCRQVTSLRYSLMGVVGLFALKALSFPLGNFIFYTEFTLFFSLLSLYALVRMSLEPQTRWLVLAGLSASFALLFKQNIGGFTVLLVAGFVLLRHRTWRSVLYTALAPAFLFFGVFLAFFVEGAIPSLYHALVIVPFSGFYPNFSTPYLPALSLTSSVADMFVYLPALFSEEFLFRKPGPLGGPMYLGARGISIAIYLIPFAVTFAVITRTWRRGHLSEVEVLLLLGGFTTFVSAFPRSDFPHVAQGVTGFVPLLVLLIYSARGRSWLQRAFAVCLAVVVVFCVILVAGIPYDHELHSSKARVQVSEDTHRITSSTLEWIEEMVPPEDKISVIPANPMYYFLASRPIPNRYTIMMAHNVGIDGGEAAIQALDEGGVDWIVYSDLYFPGFQPLEVYAPKLHGHLESEFERVRPLPSSDPPGTRLLRRKPRASPAG